METINFSIYGLTLHLKHREYVLEKFRNLINAKENPNETHDRMYKLIAQNLWLLDDKFLFFKKASATKNAYDIHCYFNGIIPGELLFLKLKSPQNSNIGQEVFEEMEQFFEKFSTSNCDELRKNFPNFPNLQQPNNTITFGNCGFSSYIVLSNQGALNFKASECKNLWKKIPRFRNSYERRYPNKWCLIDPKVDKQFAMEFPVYVFSYNDLFEKLAEKIKNRGNSVE